MLSFFEGLNSLEKDRLKKAGSTSDVSPILHDMEYFLQSHPYTEERLERLKNK